MFMTVFTFIIAIDYKTLFQLLEITMPIAKRHCLLPHCSYLSFAEKYYLCSSFSHGNEMLEIM